MSFLENSSQIVYVPSCTSYQQRQGDEQIVSQFRGIRVVNVISQFTLLRVSKLNFKFEEGKFDFKCDGKRKIRLRFSFCCNLNLKFIKITTEFTLTERWEAGNYHIIFWSMTLKAEFSNESPHQLLYICSIYVATIHVTNQQTIW